ncbi:MAG: DNA mismatch repair endonuclease MutL [Anaerolineaceae bacterium]|jgi:DNA mismatch repair protein MutL|nr:MAG: DNA mismatch repair endonuclease MutL [Anaerolineaceae bacterium]
MTLDYNTVVKIAAGEVIDRPASIVRELIDNSLDAAATVIKVAISGGGKQYIEVQDDGCGMDKSDLELCTKNHTTSKIGTFDDIIELRTLGFRGEALSSIAEVADMTVLSRLRHTQSGYRMETAFGRFKSFTETGMNTGTTIIVKDLFGNLPARKKFLSNDSTETRFVNQEILKKALAFHDTGFEFSSHGERKYLASPKRTLVERIVEFFPDTVEHLIPWERHDGGIKITAYLTKPAFIRPNRSYQYFFVNRRAVEWKHFYFAIQNAYGNLIPKGYFPAVFLYLEIDPAEVDFNVHPMKKEVRFREESVVSKAVQNALREALSDSDGISPADESEMRFTPYERKIAGAIGGFLDGRSAGSLGMTESPRISPPHTRNENSSPRPSVPERELFPARPAEESAKIDYLDYRYVGIVFSAYIMLEGGDQLLFIDQHAAHERINYEKMRDKYRSGHTSSQELLVPVQIDIPLKAADMFRENLDTLGSMGFEIEHFGGNSYVIRSIPDYIDYNDTVQTVMGFIETLTENSGGDPHSADFIDSAIKQMACKASVRAGEKITEPEVRELLKNLAGTSMPFSCPHGRPVIFSLGKTEIEKQFKRLGF